MVFYWWFLYIMVILLVVYTGRTGWDSNSWYLSTSYFKYGALNRSATCPYTHLIIGSIRLFERDGIEPPTAWTNSFTVSLLTIRISLIRYYLYSTYFALVEDRTLIFGTSHRCSNHLSYQSFHIHLPESPIDPVYNYWKKQESNLRWRYAKAIYYQLYYFPLTLYRCQLLYTILICVLIGAYIKVQRQTLLVMMALIKWKQLP